MKIEKAIVIIGIIMTLGTIFHLQGQSIVGPSSSFMYSNPDWITYGLQIAVFGAAVTVVGMVITTTKSIR